MQRFGLFTPLVLVLVLGLAACAPAAAPTAVPVPTTAPAIPPATAPAVAPVSTTDAAAAARPTPGPGAAATASAFPTLAPGPAIKLARVTGFGLFLTDEKDRTLYAFDKDSKDTSTCTGNCGNTWPPYIVSAAPQAAFGINATLVSAFKRADGTLQGEYDVHPLYYYSGDKNPGDYKGHNVGNVWHVLSPRGSTMTNAAPTAAP